MIQVLLFATLPEKSASGLSQFKVPARPGLTVGAVIEAEGLKPGDVHIVMINGLHGNLESELQDGDRLGLFPAVGGG